MVRNVEVGAEKTGAHVPSGPELGQRTRKGGLNPFAVAAAAFVLGALVAKIIDWRGHAHPKR